MGNNKTKNKDTFSTYTPENNAIAS